MDGLSTAICRIVAEELQLPDVMVRPESRVEADLGIDSLAAVRIGVGIEERFGIEMPEMPDITTIDDLIKLVRERLTVPISENA
jgi:acyl carrier protein